MRVFVTGHLGYIGAHAVELLMQEGHYVRGLDLNLYECSTFSPITLPQESIIDDIFNLTEADLAGFDAVIHLAGISNDPMGAFAPALTRRVNLEGTLHLARIAKAAGVQRFIFSSSCSIYGKAGDRMLAEDDEINPVTEYGRTKVESEQRLSEMADSSFSPTYLRNATAYGTSPRLRLDLVLNSLCAWAAATGEIRIISDGTPWRPLIDCRDIARAFIFMAQAPLDKIHDQAFNVGVTEENYRVRDLVDAILGQVRSARAVYTGEGSPDSRDYRVDFSKLATTFPEFRIENRITDGIRRLLEDFRTYGLSREMVIGPRFIRLQTLKSEKSAWVERALSAVH